MRTISNQELMNINGGGFSFGILAGIGAFLVLVGGIVDGFLRPKTCND